MAVEITAVVKLNFTANCISFERRLVVRACSVVCVTTHIRRTEIKAARDTLDAIDKSRKNLQALIQNGIDEYRINEGAIKQTTINVDKVLINFSKELCPACRKKVVGLVIKEEEEKEEEDI